MSKFCNIIENITSKHVYIQTHNFPDADAIASAFGLSVLLENMELFHQSVTEDRLRDTARMNL